MKGMSRCPQGRCGHGRTALADTLNVDEWAAEAFQKPANGPACRKLRPNPTVRALRPRADSPAANFRAENQKDGSYSMSASNSPTLDSNVSMSTYVQSPGSSEDAGGLAEKSLAEKSTGSDQSDESKRPNAASSPPSPPAPLPKGEGKSPGGGRGVEGCQSPQ